MLIGLLLLVVSVWFAANDYRMSGSPGSDLPRETSWARSAPMPDVMVSAIEIVPLVPVAGKPFDLHVFCQNIGIVPTGTYGVTVTVRNSGGDAVYLNGVAHNRMLEPGQTGAAFATKEIRLERPGRYEVSVQVSPEGFEDSSAENNRASRTFDVR